MFFIENVVLLEIEVVLFNCYCIIFRKVVYSKILGIECEWKVKVDISFYGNLWILVLRD